MTKKEELLETISNITYLYSTKRLQNNYFFQQDKTDLEYLLTLLRKHKYKDSQFGLVKLDDLINNLDKDGYLSNEFLEKNKK